VSIAIALFCCFASGCCLSLGFTQQVMAIRSPALLYYNAAALLVLGILFGFFPPPSLR
jgi:hypothetical protein